MVLKEKDEWHHVDTIWVSNGDKNSIARIEFRLQFASFEEKSHAN